MVVFWFLTVRVSSHRAETYRKAIKWHYCETRAPIFIWKDSLISHPINKYGPLGACLWSTQRLWYTWAHLTSILEHIWRVEWRPEYWKVHDWAFPWVWLQTATFPKLWKERAGNPRTLCLQYRLAQISKMCHHLWGKMVINQNRAKNEGEQFFPPSFLFLSVLKQDHMRKGINWSYFTYLSVYSLFFFFFISFYAIWLLFPSYFSLSFHSFSLAWGFFFQPEKESLL